MNTIANTLNREKIRTSFDKVKIICMLQKKMVQGKKLIFISYDCSKLTEDIKTKERS